MADSQWEHDASSAFDALYRDYLLRDFFAKIVPGSCCIALAAYALGRFGRLLDISFAASMFLAGLSWGLGFAVQEAAERLKLLVQHPPEYSPSKKRYDFRQDFLKAASKDEKKRVERYTVIKEATGNLCLALIAGSLLIAVFRWRQLGESALSTLAIAFALASVCCFLTLASRDHMQKEYDYMSRVLAHRGSG